MASSSVRQVPYILFGLGGVGRGLISAIIGKTFENPRCENAAGDHHIDCAGAAKLHRESFGVEFVAVALCDSTGVIGDSEAQLSTREVQAALETKEAGAGLSGLPRYVARPAATLTTSPAEFLSSVVAKAPAGTVVVDCTATDATVPALLASVRRGLKVVCANKKPFTGPQVEYDELTTTTTATTAPPLSSSASSSGGGGSEGGGGIRRLASVRFESAVGAGLPVIAALTRTVSAGDPISKINGTFSGFVVLYDLIFLLFFTFVLRGPLFEHVICVHNWHACW
jgi:aspartokinase/homoserine dehydrogenase 1